MSINKDLLNPIVLDILTNLKSKPQQRYQDLKDTLNISDATLSNKMKLLKGYEIIEPHSTKNKTGRNFVIYSLTPIGVKVEEALRTGLEQVVVTQ